MNSDPGAAAMPDDDEIDHGGADNPITAPGLPPAEAKARLTFARRVYSITKANRTPEGVFNGDTGKWEPTVREDCGQDPPRPCAPRRLKGWAHVYYLCMRACDGLDVPPDIAKFRDELWPALHAKFYENAVDEAQAAESAKHVEQQRKAAKRAKLLAEAQVAESRDARIKAAQERIKSYDAKIAQHTAKIRALETRKKRALRSITALKRFAEKEESGG